MRDHNTLFTQTPYARDAAEKPCGLSGEVVRVRPESLWSGGASPLPRLLKRLRLPEGSSGVWSAETVWNRALALAHPVFFKLSLTAFQFMELLKPHEAWGPYLAFHLKEYTEVWLLTATIGPALEEKARELFAEGLAFEGYATDFFGVWLVDQTMRRAIASLKTRGGTLTRRLMPGAPGFPLAAQAVFVELAGQALGLSLTRGHGLVPEKSVTAVIGRK